VIVVGWSSGRSDIQADAVTELEIELGEVFVADSEALSSDTVELREEEIEEDSDAAESEVVLAAAVAEIH
jgi:hypothetical protein